MKFAKYAALLVGIACSTITFAAPVPVVGTINENWHGGTSPNSFYDAFYANYERAFASTPGVSMQEVAYVALPQVRGVTDPYKVNDIVNANSAKLKQLAFPGNGYIALVVGDAITMELTDLNKGEFTINVSKNVMGWEVHDSKRDENLKIKFPGFVKTNFKVAVGQAKAREISELLSNNKMANQALSAIFYVKPTAAKANIGGGGMVFSSLEVTADSFDVAMPLKGSATQTLFHVEKGQFLDSTSANTYGSGGGQFQGRN